MKLNITSLKNTYRRFRAFIGRPLLIRQRTVVTLDGADYCQNPIFVMGCHRSGTSLLRRILNSHRNIVCPPETNFLIHFFNLLDDQSSVSGLSGLLDEEQIVPEVMRQAFRFHEAYRLANGKSRWADKTPQYVLEYGRIKRYAPSDTQYVVIFRDPYEIAYSIYSRGWRLGQLDQDLLTNTLLYVRMVVEKLIEISSDPNAHALCYEKLVADAETETKNLCAFLNEEWDEAMLRPWDFDHNFGTEDPIARSIKGFKLSSGHWKGLPPEDLKELEVHLSELRRKLNYA